MRLVDKARDGEPRALADGEPYAQMVMLSKTDRSTGSVLGCFMLELPRPPLPEGSMAPKPQDLELDCHAFGDKAGSQAVAFGRARKLADKFLTNFGFSQVKATVDPLQGDVVETSPSASGHPCWAT